MPTLAMAAVAVALVAPGAGPGGGCARVEPGWRAGAPMREAGHAERPHRRESGVLWWSGACNAYGVVDDGLAAARVDHVVVTVRALRPIEGGGVRARMENERNAWLRERGLIERVRTHTKRSGWGGRGAR